VAWFFKGKGTPDMAILEKEVLESPLSFPNELKEKLKLLNPDQRWEFIKKQLTTLEKTKARNLVRLLFGENTAYITERLDCWEEREYAIECLGYLPSRETVEILVKLLSHKDDIIQLMAAGALKNHTPRLVVPYLIELLLNSQVLPSRVGEVLLEMDFLAQDSLLEVYERAGVQVKAQIIELLTVSRNPKCKPFLGSALLSEDSALKKAALQAVAAFSFKDLWLEAAYCLADPAWQIRAKTIEILTKLRVKEALELVKPFLKDEDPWVREGAETCIAALEKAD
jgi:HEAT repeat protein